MTKLKTALAALAILIILLLIALAFWPTVMISPQQAPAAKNYQVEIIRDDYGVPHIYGKTNADVGYGIAYAHAEDDFETLQHVAAMTRARYGEILGEKGAEVDFTAHLLDIRGTVDRHYGDLPDDVKAVLDGYAAGLNHYAGTHEQEILIPHLFPLNGRDIAAGFALRSPFFYGLDKTLGALVSGKELPVEGGAELDDDGNVIGEKPDKAIETDGNTDETASANGITRRITQLANVSPATPFGNDAALNGSNAFALSPDISDSGTTRLVSNTHQPWRGPVAWYELVVESEEGWHFAGATFPGAPWPLMGHNENLGWTNTVNRPDLVDIYQLKMDDSGENYLMDGKPYPLESKRVWLHVKMGAFTLPIPKTIYRSSHHGPVIKNDKGVFAFRYAGMDSLKLLTQYFRLNLAQNFDEWKEVMAIQGIPSTNFIYADKQGNIAYYYNALFPDRKGAANWRSVIAGDKSALIPQNPVPFNAYPALINPASGYIMNANNTPFVAAGPGDEMNPDSYSPLLGVELDMTNRGKRAITLLEAALADDGLISNDELMAVKYDRVYAQSGYAKAMMDAVMAVKSNDPIITQSQKILKKWDWEMDGKGQGDALALIIMRKAISAYYSREPLPEPEETVKLAALHLQKYFGSLDPALGDVLRLKNGDVDLPMDGGSDTLRASTSWNYGDNGRLNIRHGDSFIMFMEWDKNGQISSRSVMPFGSATTRPNSPHFSDQSRLFVEHKTKPVYFYRKDMAKYSDKKYQP